MQLLRNIDYRIQGYHKKKVYDTKGDVSEVGFYKTYTPPVTGSTGTYTGLKVKETRTITRDVVLGIPNKIDMLIEWFKGDGVTTADTKTITKHINSYDGMRMNQEARTNLMTKAQGYLLGEVGLANTQEFGTDVMSEREAYIAGTRGPLIDLINNSSRPYMTTEIKNTLVAILDIAF